MNRILILTEDERKTVEPKEIMLAHLIIVTKPNGRYDIIKNINGKLYTDIYSYDIKNLLDRYL